MQLRKVPRGLWAKNWRWHLHGHSGYINSKLYVLQFKKKKIFRCRIYGLKCWTMELYNWSYWPKYEYYPHNYWFDLLLIIFGTSFNKIYVLIDYKILTFSQNYFGTFTHVLNMIWNTKLKERHDEKVVEYHIGWVAAMQCIQTKVVAAYH